MDLKVFCFPSLLLGYRSYLDLDSCRYPRFVGYEELAHRPTSVHPRWEKISPSDRIREPHTLASF